MLKKLYDHLVVKQASDPVNVKVSREGVVYVDPADLIRNDGAKRQIDAMNRLAEQASLEEARKDKLKAAE